MVGDGGAHLEPDLLHMGSIADLLTGHLRRLHETFDGAMTALGVVRRNRAAAAEPRGRRCEKNSGIPRRERTRERNRATDGCEHVQGGGTQGLPEHPYAYCDRALNDSVWDAGDDQAPVPLPCAHRTGRLVLTRCRLERAERLPRGADDSRS